MLRIASIGECMIELSESSEAGGRMQRTFGGDTLNTAVYLARRHYRRNAYRRVAMLQLQHSLQAFQSSGNASRFICEINALLKSVALLAYPRNEIAAIHGSVFFVIPQLVNERQV